MKRIMQLPLQDRPREKLETIGAKSLSDQELLQAILGSGTRSSNVTTLAEQVLKVINDKNEQLTAKCFFKIKGIGKAKSSLICAALEFARRRIRPEGQLIKKAEDVFPLICHFGDQKQEHFICITLNGAHEVITTRVVTIGLVNSTQIHPREVFSDSITDRATAIIIAHNHPSGSLEPSPEDLKTTKLLQEAGKILGITLLDHIIFSKKKFISLKDDGYM